MISLSFLFLLCVHFAFVDAALYILDPVRGSTCRGGQPCNVFWEDDGQSPLLSAIGIATVALYTGKQQLVQVIPPVNVASTSSLSFTPLPGAGPDSDDYYIAFTSTEVNGTDDLPYVGFSPFFGLRDMSGSFTSPLPAAISSIPIPQSIKNLSTPSGTATATVGSLSTSLPRSSPSLRASSSVPVTSGFSTSQAPTLTSSSTASFVSASATAKNKNNGSPRLLPGPLPVLFMALFTFTFFA